MSDSISRMQEMVDDMKLVSEWLKDKKANGTKFRFDWRFKPYKAEGKAMVGIDAYEAVVYHSGAWSVRKNGADLVSGRADCVEQGISLAESSVEDYLTDEAAAAKKAEELRAFSDPAWQRWVLDMFRSGPREITYMALNASGKPVMHSYLAKVFQSTFGSLYIQRDDNGRQVLAALDGETGVAKAVRLAFGPRSRRYLDRNAGQSKADKFLASMEDENVHVDPINVVETLNKLAARCKTLANRAGTEGLDEVAKQLLAASEDYHASAISIKLANLVLPRS